MTSVPPKTLADRLDDIRRSRFIGRTAEIELFRGMLDRRSRAAILHVHGVGGIGKSTLLAEFARLAETKGRPVLQIDARNVPPTLQAFQSAANTDGAPPGIVLLVDSLDHQDALGQWLMRDFLPSLPADAVVVLAGRTKPDLEWRLDPGYAELMRVVTLDPLGAADADALLRVRGVAAADLGAATAAGHGHPLALALLADAIAAGRTDLVTSPTERVRLFADLVGRFTTDVPTPQHADALRLLILARNTTASMIADILGTAHGPALTDWLAMLPFVERGPHGLTPHDLVREVLEGDWLHQDTEGLERLRQGAMRHIHRQMVRNGPDDRHRLSQDWTFLVRDTPLWRYLDWTRFNSFYAGPLAASDTDAAVDMVRSALGPESARIATHWIGLQPGGWMAVHDGEGAVCGVLCTVDLMLVDRSRPMPDPVTAAALDAVVHHRPDRVGQALLSRFCVHGGSLALPNPTFDSRLARTQPFG